MVEKSPKQLTWTSKNKETHGKRFVETTFASMYNWRNCKFLEYTRFKTTSLIGSSVYEYVYAFSHSWTFHFYFIDERLHLTFRDLAFDCISSKEIKTFNYCFLQSGFHTYLIFQLALVLYEPRCMKEPIVNIKIWQAFWGHSWPPLALDVKSVGH